METDIMQKKKDEQLEKDIKATFKSGDDISVSIVQRKFTVGYFRACRVSDKLIKDGYFIKSQCSGSYFKYR